ncbi:hypothetical protein RUESEDTHA_03375 [Ruegeria sp. THAF57]|uniref:hypothetical protein n=1 Tax=Ruegeria sp. THAF57 TaxID=2744555 RepID=UPI0015DD5F29|nr:hypothetical protein [Ruegeria sp. THAF57]CAD0186467.1 hypothetical protein RUESEDTHA_03375 [Ruegeria sp. THAF57]
MLRILTLITGLTLLGACAQTQLYEEPESLGEFKLRVNYAFAEKAVQGPVSRDATPDEWTAAIQNAVDVRLGRYEGAQEYDIGISLEGYMLAPPGIPVIYNPKSTAIVLVNVYDVKNKEFLAKGKQFQVLEDTTGESALTGSGNTRTREEQMSGLALKVADRVEEWLAEEHEENGWFQRRPDLIQPLESGELTQNPAS